MNVNLGTLNDKPATRSTTRRPRFKSALWLIMWASALDVIAQGGSPVPPAAHYASPSNEQILQYLGQSLEWYRVLSDNQQIEMGPTDYLDVQESREVNVQAVRLSFDFARAAAAFNGNAASTSPPTGGKSVPLGTSIEHFLQLQSDAQNAEKRAQAELGAIRGELASARGPKRRNLQMSANDMESRIEILEARISGLKDLIDFIRSKEHGLPQASELGSAIDELAQSVPVATESLDANQGRTNPGPQAVLSDHRGIFGSIYRIMQVQRTLRTINRELELTNALSRVSLAFHDPLASCIREAISEAGGPEVESQTDNEVAPSRINALVARTQRLLPAIESLDKQAVLLSICKTQLSRLHSAVIQQYENVWWEFTIRVIVLLLILCGVMIAVITLRRVTMRLISDANRCRMFLALEQLLGWLTAILVVACFVAADARSMITFLGLFTAGAAVALQNVILAVLGYFVLVGKRGMKVGDVVTISDITGEVINIGLLQFQLRQIENGSGTSTQRLVTFSNSFVFVSPATGLANASDTTPRPSL